MDRRKAIEILRDYKLWSCGKGKYSNYKECFKYTKAELNEAIDVAINSLETNG